MTGWLYKEFRHYRLLVLGALLVPVICIWAPLLMEFLGGLGEQDAPLRHAFRMMKEQSASYFLMMITALLIFGMLLQAVFNGDEVKKWACFVSSTPNGIKAFLCAKYLFVLMLCGLFYLSVFWNESLFMTVGYLAYGTELPALSDFVLMMLLVILLLRAVDYAAIARFGTMFGVKVKGILFVGLWAFGAVWLLFGPLPDDIDSAVNAVTGFFTKLMTGTYSEQIGLIIGLLPPAALLAYYLSYQLSCRLYMKGVEQYAK